MSGLGPFATQFGMFKNPPQVVASEPEIVVKAKETPTQRHRIDQEAKQLKTRTIGRLVTCRLRQSKFGVAGTQILLSRAKNLGFRAESLGKMLSKDACKCFELIAGLPDLNRRPTARRANGSPRYRQVVPSHRDRDRKVGILLASFQSIV
jgi:hypothetical protein